MYTYINIRDRYRTSHVIMVGTLLIHIVPWTHQKFKDWTRNDKLKFGLRSMIRCEFQLRSHCSVENVILYHKHFNVL